MPKVDLTPLQDLFRAAVLRMLLREDRIDEVFIRKIILWYYPPVSVLTSSAGAIPEKAILCPPAINLPVEIASPQFHSLCKIGSSNHLRKNSFVATMSADHIKALILLILHIVLFNN